MLSKSRVLLQPLVVKAATASQYSDDALVNVAEVVGYMYLSLILTTSLTGPAGVRAVAFGIAVIIVQVLVTIDAILS